MWKRRASNIRCTRGRSDVRFLRVCARRAAQPLECVLHPIPIVANWLAHNNCGSRSARLCGCCCLETKEQNESRRGVTHEPILRNRRPLEVLEGFSRVLPLASQFPLTSLLYLLKPRPLIQGTRPQTYSTVTPHLLIVVCLVTQATLKEKCASHGVHTHAHRWRSQCVQCGTDKVVMDSTRSSSHHVIPDSLVSAPTSQTPIDRRTQLSLFGICPTRSLPRAPTWQTPSDHPQQLSVWRRRQFRSVWSRR